MNYDFILLIMWFIVCGCAMLTVWVWLSIGEINSDKRRLQELDFHARGAIKQLNERVDGIEKKLMRDGYRPPNKK